MQHIRKPSAVKSPGLLVVLTAILLLAGCGAPRHEGTSPWIRWRAEQEGELVIYANTNLMEPVLEAFRRKHPGIRIRLEDLNSTRMAAEVRALADAGRTGPDIVWSSAMDVQVKLINDGYAATYRSPNRAGMPDGSVWRNQGFGITAEPIVFAYNRRLLPADAVPRSHAELLDLLQTRREVFEDRIIVYDAEASGVALMQLSADVQIYPDAWRLMDALGRAHPRLDTSGQRMMGQMASGRRVFAYNMNQSYAASWAARNPDIALVTPADYHLSVSRVAFIARNAAHPHAARLFLDFLLSVDGQKAVALTGARPVRTEAVGAAGVPVSGVRPIRVGPALLANLDHLRRERLLVRWREAMDGSPRAPLDPTAP